MTTDATFWDFSLRFYASPGVASACLRCQDEAGADVNLMLFALWHAASGTTLHQSDMEAADAAVAPWREHVVKPLRSLRRALKSPPLASLVAACGFRKQIQAVELDSEHLEQEMLTASVPRRTSTAPPLEAARANLAAYAAATGLALPEEALAILLAAFTQSTIS
jgi:uncharacterized protein (TIGR02444 family)